MSNTSLKKKLLRLLEKDQSIRQSNNKWDFSVDTQNTKELKKIIQEHGWPVISEVGEDAARGAWLIAQHSPDFEFQKKCLELIKKKAKEGEAKKEWVAYLTDRILIHENEKQLFGTQFKVDKDRKKFIPHPIARSKTLNKRREEYDLEPFENYRKKFRDEDVKDFIKKFNKETPEE